MHGPIPKLVGDPSPRAVVDDNDRVAFRSERVHDVADLPVVVVGRDHDPDGGRLDLSPIEADCVTFGSKIR